ncbi:MAG: DEAD/DEAH box helicase family protein [Symploca sp. SIO2D2]|nr:DEAD/DEAH box helicase family protein [Symploca sp. SIO2D2]
MSQNFVPRDWQERFVREYQTNPKKNFLVEACTSSGKTGGALYAYNSLKDGFDWRFVVVVVPAEHLRRQYAQDAAKLFGLNFYYSGTDKRLRRLPTPDELLQQGYHGIVISYHWLTKSGNADSLKNSFNPTLAGKIFVILDEVHHASSDLAFGQACEAAFPDHIVSHRLMTSGTPFRSDNNRILGNWVSYVYVEDNVYKCSPDFCYTLADALNEEIIPPFSFVTMAGEFTYRRTGAVYKGKTFTNAQNEDELKDALKTAIYVEGDWVKTAIEWAHKRMKRDRAKGLPECATYVRVPTIQAARQIKERIRRLTGEDALVVVSKDDDPNPKSSFSSNKNSEEKSELIEQFAAETGATAKSWIVGVGMLGEGVSIHRLKYRIHATNICAPLSFMQDLGRLLRKFPEDSPEAVETLIPAHPTLIDLAISAMDEVAHVVQERDEEELKDENSNSDGEGDRETLPSSFEALASTGELATQIVDGEEISNEYANIAEWAVANKEIWKHWGKTPAHLAQMLQHEQALFDLLRQEYQVTINQKSSNHNTSSTSEILLGFPSEYSSWLPDEKAKYVRKEVNKKTYRLACLLYSSNDSEEEIQEKVKKIHTKAKQKNGLPLNGFISYEGWEEIYAWLCDRIADAAKRKGMEDL